MSLKPTDINEVIENVTKMLRRLVGENIFIECRPSSVLPMVRADEGMMEQVVMNLVVNARDAMPHGGRLQMKTEPCVLDAITVRSHPEGRAGEFICLTVQDEGCGMSPEVMARIFEPFFTTKDVGKGTGLGLATVYGIVSQHQGWIEVESQVGLGTTFRVYLPADKLLVASKGTNGENGANVAGHETVMLVEDEEAVRTLASIVLQKYGYRVVEASSSAEAFQLWKRYEGEVAMLITDVMIPGTHSGHELVRELRKERPDLKVLYTSGYDLDRLGAGSLGDEHDFVLQKPYLPKKLAEMVRQVLDARLHQELCC
jgi:CheY-like chemotaxis protein